MTDRALVLLAALALAACDRAEAPRPAADDAENAAVANAADMLDTSPDSLAAPENMAVGGEGEGR